MKSKPMKAVGKMLQNSAASVAAPVRVPLDGLATKREAAVFLHVCLKTVDRLIKRKVLPKTKIGRASRIPWTALHRLAGTDA